jgi:hypothetical protein
VSKLHPKQRKRSSRPPVGQLYIELGCSHIVPLTYLDEYIDPKIKTVMPKQCPKCHQIITASYRYGNAAKRAMNDIEHISDEIKLHLSIPTNERKELLRTIFELSEEYTNISIPLATHLRIFRKKLKGDITSEERCFMQCLSSCTKLYVATKCTVKAFPDVHVIMTCLERVATNFVKSATMSFKSRGRDRAPITYKLSWQLLEDFMSELYRLALSAQCIIARYKYPLTEISHACVGKTGPDHVLASVESFVHSLDPLKNRISTEDYENYSTQIEAAIPTVATVHVLSLNPKDPDYVSDDEAPFPTVVNLHVQTPILPSVIKGTWMKCPAGHYYCKPPIYGSGAKQKTLSYCPKCT